MFPEVSTNSIERIESLCSLYIENDTTQSTRTGKETSIYGRARCLMMCKIAARRVASRVKSSHLLFNTFYFFSAATDSFAVTVLYITFRSNYHFSNKRPR